MWDPIQNLDKVDITAVRHDGGVDLIIIASSKLDGSPKHQRLLLDKVEGYLGDIKSPEFRQEFGTLTSDQIRIKLVLYSTWESPMPELAERIKSWVKGEGATFLVETRNEQP